MGLIDLKSHSPTLSGNGELGLKSFKNPFFFCMYLPDFCFFFEEILQLKNVWDIISYNKVLLHFLIRGMVRLLQNVEDDHFS